VAGLVATLVVWRAHRSLAERHREIVAAFSDALGLPVQAEGVRATWWPPGLVVEGIRIPDESPLGPGDLAHADEARLAVGMWPLLSGTVVVRRVEVTAPVVRLVRGVDGSWNFGGASRIGPAPAGSSPGGAARPAEADDGGRGGDVGAPSVRVPQFDVVELAITRGRVSLRDRAIPGVPELEITSAEARLHRSGEGSTLRFEGSALGGPSGNLRGRLRIPAGGDVGLELAAREVPAARLPEVLQLVRGGVPFGAILGGVVSATLTGRMPNRWPPGRAEIAVTVDARQATASMAEAYVHKAVGLPLVLTLDLLAGPHLLHVRHAAVESGEARVEMTTTGDADAVVDRQPALRFASSALTA